MSVKSVIILVLTALSIWALVGCSKHFQHSVQQVAPPAQAGAGIPNYEDSTITLAAGTHYDRSSLHTFLYGKHYRSAWVTPVTVPVLDIGTAKGGLTPTELGGSRQTRSLRLQNPAGVEYVIRSVDKDPASVLPEKWQNSYVANIIRDANTALHPYAALVIPPMADAVGVYHTKPELVYVPHDPRLGEFTDKIGGTLALLERRPADSQTDNPAMGRAKDVKSSHSALEERFADNDTHFDARFYLRARFLDMLLGDWSRHEDNWRWAEYKNEKKGHAYRAIPRDRDNAFYKIKDAPIPWLFMQLGLKPQYQTFRDKITQKNLEGLNRSGQNLDKLILAELSLQDWLEVADSVQQQLTDDVIERSFKEMPAPVYKKTAAPMVAKLKARRDQLPQVARTYYTMLAHTTELVGTDKHERFEIEVLSPEQVRVQEYKIEKDGDKEQLLLDRTFTKSETDELDFYGLNGDDQFIISGSVEPKIALKFWGGAGEDLYEVKDRKSNVGKSIHINDSKYRNTLNVGKHAAVEVDDEIAAKNFDAAGWLLRYYLD